MMTDIDGKTLIKKVYISGPMTGYQNNNFDAFNTMAKFLDSVGIVYENPAEKGIIDGWSWHDYMRYDIVKLMDCDAIIMLPYWSKSQGACLEYKIAKALNFTIFVSVTELLDSLAGLR